MYVSHPNNCKTTFSVEDMGRNTFAPVRVQWLWGQPAGKRIKPGKQIKRVVVTSWTQAISKFYLWWTGGAPWVKRLFSPRWPLLSTLRPFFSKKSSFLLPLRVGLHMFLLPSGILAFLADLWQFWRRRWPGEVHLTPLAALYVHPWCPPLMSALKSALNVAFDAALERKTWKTMHSRHTGKRPPKHSSGNTVGTLKGRPLWHRWSQVIVASVNAHWWRDFLNASITPCSAGTATSIHPLTPQTLKMFPCAKPCPTARALQAEMG